MKNKLASVLMIFGVLVVLNVPVLVMAQSSWSPNDSLVTCKENCGWPELVSLINRIISFLLYLATILAIFAFIYAGFNLMTSGGNEGKAKEAKEVFFKVVVGLIFAYGAWILVYFILNALQVGDGFKLI